MADEKKKVGAGFGVIVLNNEGKVLLGKRHDDPVKADSALRGEGTWSLPGGKLDWGETFEEGAIRETKEETGLTIFNPKVISVHNCKNEHAHFMTVGLLAERYEGEPQVMEPDEMTKWEWFDLDKLPQPGYFPSYEVIENYKQGQFYIKRS
jgi:8-oxo-dGTP diphosphatase